MTESSVNFSSTLTAEEVRRESLQIRACWIAFLFLGADRLLMPFVVPSYVPVFEKVDGAQRLTGYATPSQARYWVAVIVPLFTLLPAAVTLLWNARSQRWRQAGRWLVGTAVGHGLLLALLALVRTPESDVAQEPIGIRLLLAADEILLWVQIWWINVLIGEFAIASRADLALARVHKLATLILFGVGAYVLSQLWLLPSGGILPKEGDTLGYFLLLVQLLLGFSVCILLLLHLTEIATIARRLVRRSQETYPPPVASASSAGEPPGGP